MWNKVIQVFLFPFLWPLYLYRWLFPIIPPKEWPYIDDSYVEDGEQIMVYEDNASGLESRLSRKLRKTVYKRGFRFKVK